MKTYETSVAAEPQSCEDTQSGVTLLYCIVQTVYYTQV